MVQYASIGCSSDTSLARDQVRGHLIVISLRKECEDGVSCERMGTGWNWCMNEHLLVGSGRVLFPFLLWIEAFPFLLFLTHVESNKLYSTFPSFLT